LVLSIRDPLKIVATGIIRSVDPEKMVGPHPLGEDWCEIDIMQTQSHDEKLIRPYSLLKTIGDAHGAPIAWPVSLVCVDN
jgi:hypothetical protein